jgi:hypothetical protein
MSPVVSSQPLETQAFTPFVAKNAFRDKTTRNPMTDAVPNLEAALEAQQTLLETSLPLAFESYDEALSRKVKHPVVLLLDCEDDIGGEIARGWLGDEAVDDAIAHQAASDPTDDATTVFAYAFSLEECRREVPPVFPYLAPALEGPPPTEGFWAIAITSGGASLLTVPLDARP